jgi:hypothetical protein
MSESPTTAPVHGAARRPPPGDDDESACGSSPPGPGRLRRTPRLAHPAQPGQGGMPGGTTSAPQICDSEAPHSTAPRATDRRSDRPRTPPAADRVDVGRWGFYGRLSASMLGSDRPCRAHSGRVGRTRPGRLDGRSEPRLSGAQPSARQRRTIEPPCVRPGRFSPSHAPQFLGNIANNSSGPQSRWSQP